MFQTVSGSSSSTCFSCIFLLSIVVGSVSSEASFSIAISLAPIISLAVSLTVSI